MAIEITFDEAKSLIQRAIDEKGADYVYPEAWSINCRYFNGDGSPSCIVGHVLHYAGVDGNDWYGTDNNESNVHNLAEDGVLALADATRILLGVAQARQDHGATWDEAMDEALREVDAAYGKATSD